MTPFCLFLVLVALVSCGVKTEKPQTASEGKDLLQQYDSVCSMAELYPERVEIRYAKGLEVQYQDDGIHVNIKGRGESQSLQLVLKPGEKHSRFICTTALQMGGFEVLGLEEDVVAINSLRNIFSEKIKEQLKTGTTRKIGKEGNFDLETVLAAKPEFIFVSASKHGGYDVLKDCGIPLIPHHGYKETDPLGQAEWIKLVGLLTGETRRANALFDYIEKEYLVLKTKVEEHLAETGVERPTILSGRQLRDGWYTMAADSYMARIFHDAGAHYLLDDLAGTGGVTLDFETVLARGLYAQYWQIDGTVDEGFTLGDLLTEDPRYADIEAVKKGQVLFCNIGKTPYRELAGVAPQLLLGDFVHAFYPMLMPGYKPMFYDKLR